MNPIGYVIYNDFEIIECSHETNYPISDNKTYYFGPLMLFEKIEDTYINLDSGETLSESSANSLYEYFVSQSQSHKLSSDETVSPCAVSSYNLPYTPKTYSYNPDSRCGSIALAITLMYYDDYIDSNVVPSWISGADSTGKYFSDLLKPHIEDTSSSDGCTAKELCDGANWYFSYRGISSSYSASRLINPTFSRYKTQIGGNRPAILLLSSHPTYGNHWVVGYGYYYQSTGSSTRSLAVINDGWGNNGREISFSYVTNMIYFNK